MYCLLGLNRFGNQIENKMHSPLHYMEIMKQIEKVCTVKVWKILEGENYATNFVHMEHYDYA